MMFQTKTSTKESGDEETHMFPTPLRLHDGAAEAACGQAIPLSTLGTRPIAGAWICPTCLIKAGEQLPDYAMVGLLGPG
jgi:hypothetical protein